MKYSDYITRNPNICGGTAVVKGTRIPIRTILGSLAEGDRIEDILHSFPTLTEEAIWAVIAFAADSAAEDIPMMPMPA